MVTILFCDTSAIIKYYRQEKGTRWMQTALKASPVARIILREITLAEVAAALAALQRASNGITKQERDQSLEIFFKHCYEFYELISINRSTVELAVDLTQNHRLRGCDSLQLATALMVNMTFNISGSLPLTFVAADHDLLVAAQAEGLSVHNPENSV